MNDKKGATVGYRCLACGTYFPVEQGSRRRYCDRCLAEKLATKKKSLNTIKTELEEVIGNHKPNSPDRNEGGERCVSF